MIAFDGPQPPPDEIAAIVTAFSTLSAPAEPAAQRSAWTLAHREPDLDIEELRARVR